MDQVPFHRIGKGGLQQGVDFVNRGAGQQPLLLLFGQGLLYAVDVLPAGSLGKGSIELLDVVGSQLLYLPLPNIRFFQIILIVLLPFFVCHIHGDTPPFTGVTEKQCGQFDHIVFW